MRVLIICLTAVCLMGAGAMAAPFPSPSRSATTVRYSLARFHFPSRGFGRRPSFSGGRRGFGRHRILRRVARLVGFALLLHFLFHSAGGLLVLLLIVFLVFALFRMLSRARRSRYPRGY